MRSGRRTPVVIRLGAALAICCLVAAWAPTLVAAQEVIGEASFDDISDEWLAWNPETCKFEPADAPGDAYDAIVRTAAEPGRWVFTPEQQQAPFILAMTKDIVDTAAAAGFEVTVLDNAYPDATRPVQVADQAVNLGVDLVISQNVLPDQYPVIQSKYTEACIPMLNIWGMPGPPDPAPQVRAIHGVNGVALANAALGLVEQKGWPTDQIWVVLCGDSLVATEPGSSIDLPEDFAETIQAALGVPDERVSPILECPTGDGNLGAREAVADWLTAHPEAQYVLANSWNDTRAIGMAQALEAAGFTKDNAIVTGRDAEVGALQMIEAGGTYQIDLDLRLQDGWGVPIVAVAQDVSEGKPVPAYVVPAATIITSENVAEALERLQ